MIKKMDTGKILMSPSEKNPNEVYSLNLNFRSYFIILIHKNCIKTYVLCLKLNLNFIQAHIISYYVHTN